MKKKVLCFVLVLAMMLVPTAAFADSAVVLVPEQQLINLEQFGRFDTEDIDFDEVMGDLIMSVAGLASIGESFYEFLGYEDGDFNLDFTKGIEMIQEIVITIPPVYDTMGVVSQLLNVNLDLRQFAPYVDMLRPFGWQ